VRERLYLPQYLNDAVTVYAADDAAWIDHINGRTEIYDLHAGLLYSAAFLCLCLACIGGHYIFTISRLCRCLSRCSSYAKIDSSAGRSSPFPGRRGLNFISIAQAQAPLLTSQNRIEILVYNLV